MRELARRGRIDASTVSRVLSNKQNPGNDFYLGVARSFGVTLESVERLERTGAVPESRMDDPTYQDLIEIAKELSEDDLAEVRDYAIYRMRKFKKLPL
jgi:transcriptional regulator with XRE-family HTH domain